MCIRDRHSLQLVDKDAAVLLKTDFIVEFHTAEMCIRDRYRITKSAGVFTLAFL